MAQNYAKSFYNSKAWKRCRDGFMKCKYYICERCGGVASIAHHKTKITPENISNPEVTLSWDNLEAVCIECHNNEHIRKGVELNGIMFDELGNAIKEK